LLEKILAAKRAEVAAARSALSDAEVERAAREAAPARDFVGAIRAKIAAGRPAVIAEAKRRSPSKGLLREPYDPAAIARSYEAAGAACLSVLTERGFFGGAPEHLAAARKASSLPLLCKDFILEPRQVFEARALGADAILLIAAALAPAAMAELERLARSLGMAVLAEVHEAAELEAVLALETPLVGINNRDLRSFETTLETTLALLPRIPDDRIAVAESGILAPQDVARLRDRGVEAFLVGEAFMRAQDPGEALASLFGQNATRAH